MGIDIGAKLIYGVPYSDLPEEILEEVNEMLDVGDLDYASPYYDAPRDEWIVGVEVYCEGLDAEGIGYSVTDAESELPSIIKDNCECGTYVSAHVS